MKAALKHTLVVLLATGLLVAGMAGTTVGQAPSANGAGTGTFMQTGQLSGSQLDSMSCNELHSTYERSKARIKASDLPSQRKQSLEQRATTLYKMYSFKKGC